MNNTVSQPPRVKLDRAAGSGKNNTEAGMARVALRIRLYLSIGVTLPMPALGIAASASPQIR